MLQKSLNGIFHVEHDANLKVKIQPSISVGAKQRLQYLQVWGRRSMASTLEQLIDDEYWRQVAQREAERAPR